MAIDYLPSGNVGSQVERAVIAHLKWYLQLANLPPINFYFANDGRDRKAPLIDVIAHKSTESPVHTRNEVCQVRVELEWPGADQPDQNPKWVWNWVNVNKFIGAVMAAMSISDTGGQDYAATCDLLSKYGRLLAVAPPGATPEQTQEALNNADMVEFTAQYLKYNGFSRAVTDGKGLYFREIRNFEIDACAANVD